MASLWIAGLLELAYCGNGAGSAGEAWTCWAPHGMRDSGAPKCSNYALSWIGMANTKFLLDLYLQGINGLCWPFFYGYMGWPGPGLPPLTLAKQMFNITDNCLLPP
jgi:hypothetical protein